MTETDVQLHLREPFDEQTAFDVLSKGWYNGAVAELTEGRLYPLTFFDPVRLAQDLEQEGTRGIPCLVEIALVGHRSGNACFAPASLPPQVV